MYIYLKTVLWPYVNWPGTKLSLMMEIPAMSDTRRPCWLSACPWVSRWWSSPRTDTLTLGSLLAKLKREGFSSILWRKILVKHERESTAIVHVHAVMWLDTCMCYTCINFYRCQRYIECLHLMYVYFYKTISPTFTNNVLVWPGVYVIIYHTYLISYHSTVFLRR